jgi:hypothetical protein
MPFSIRVDQPASDSSVSSRCNACAFCSCVLRLRSASLCIFCWFFSVCVEHSDESGGSDDDY